MAGRFRGYVEIQLDRPRRLHYDMEALAEFEEISGKPFHAVFKAGGRGIGIDVLRKILWAGLIHEDQTLLLDSTEGVRSVGRWMDLVPGDDMNSRLEYVSSKIAEAVQLCLGPGGDSKKKTVTEETERRA